MQNPETLKRSIHSAEDLANVVRTMKTMAAVSIRQYETAAESLKIYAGTVKTGLRMLLKSGRAGSIRLGHEDIQKTGLVIFGSDQGMCGQFNEQIAHQAAEIVSESQSTVPATAPCLCVGHRVADCLTTVDIPVEQIFALPGSATGITFLVQDLLPVIDRWRHAWQIDRILVLHNRRQSASTWKPHRLPLLPLQPDQLLSGSNTNSETENSSCLPYWTMDSNILFSRLVRQFLFVSLFRACAESLAGENASRIAAMQAAERNIKDRIHSLKTAYGQSRQTAITEELLDVVVGFEALSQEG